MVTLVAERRIGGRILYFCEACGLAYEERIWAEKCEDFCSKHNACSLQITRHAVNVDLEDLEK
ncbi:MAG: hypothetical protein LZ169_00700 [Thaumarchaeota archaeon]|nr:hypothetical protein [Candidatus Wolframiiraptor allenii]